MQVLTNPINLYIIWYGTWAVTEKSVIRTALSSLTPAVPITDFPNLSNLWTVMTKYYQDVSGQAFVTSYVSVVQEIDDGSVYKVINSSSDPLLIVTNNIAAGFLPADYQQGVYFVLTAADITYTDIPDHYCGYHGDVCVGQNSGADCTSPLNYLLYAFVPVPMDKFSGCNLFPNYIPGTPPNFAVSPTGALDSMISILMHELLELTADPYVGELSAVRASSVVRLFIDAGVAPERLTAVGHGANIPVASNDDPQGRARNRRVAVTILSGLPDTVTELPAPQLPPAQ